MQACSLVIAAMSKIHTFSRRDFWYLSLNMRSLLLLLFLPVLTSAYYFDYENVMYYKVKCSNCSFGYNVYLYSEKINSTEGPKSWMIVGAPKDTTNVGNTTKEMGSVYRCEVKDVGRECQSITVENPEIYDLRASGRYPITIETEHGGLGAAVALSELDGLLTVCAPRTNLIMHNETNTDEIVTQTMHGVCYRGQAASGNLSVNYHDIETYDFTSDYYANPSIGFAVHYPRWQRHSSSASPMIGSPSHEVTGTLYKMGTQNYIKPQENIERDFYSLFGYAISSGYYFDRLNLMVAGGAPQWNFTGQVQIRNYIDNSTAMSVLQMINGTEYGEFFGASLATGDLNNDGLDDLVVGAPHWKNDNGRVYIYMGSKARFSKANMLLEGKVIDALFGYAMTSGDIDNDGYDDLVVSAPWEKLGVIYVYTGGAELQKLYSMIPSQTIEAYRNARTFGFSLSNILDVNGDGFGDMAVGAYASARAIIMISKPCVTPDITLSTDPSVLLPNTTSLLLMLCRNQSSNSMRSIVTFTVGQLYNDAPKSSYQCRIGIQNRCCNETINLQNIVSNNVDDIEIAAEQTFACLGMVMNRHVSARKRLTFDISCGNRVCPVNISAALAFQDLSNESTYIIGSNDLSLVLMIRNAEYPAYSTTATFYIPEGVSLKGLPRSCDEIRDHPAVIVTCDVGSPLKNSIQKNISLDLDMSKIRNVSLNGTELDFTVDIRTPSTNELLKVASSLQLKTDVSIASSGKVNNKITYFGYDEKSSKLAFQHNYEISLFGETPIAEVFFNISVPYKFDDLKFLAIPQIIILGSSHKCTVSHELSEQGTSSDILETTTTVYTSTTEASQLQCDNKIPAQSYTLFELANLDIVYLNCSSPNITCEQVTCAIPFLDTGRVTEKLQVALVIDIYKLTGQANKKEITIHFATEASAFLDPKMQLDVPGAGIPFSLMTTFQRTSTAKFSYSIFNTILKEYNRPEKDIGYLIILGSMLLGLLILGLMILVLRDMGFFERPLREQRKMFDRLEEMAMNPYCRADDEYHDELHE